MKRILVLLVGGTICSAPNEAGYLAIDRHRGALLKEFYEKSDSPFAGQVEICLSENLSILSENMTVEKINRIVSLYRKETAKQTYDGVIIAHGTDTLAYTAAFFSFLFADTPHPILFVSANRPLDFSGSNGHDNFRFAVECICRGIGSNVYAVYKNISDGRTYLHLASRLRQCQNYSEDFFSVGATDITDLSDQTAEGIFSSVEQKFPQAYKKCADVCKTGKILRDRVLVIEPYAGLRYDAYRLDGFDAVLHGTYHSGTVCTDGEGKNSVLPFLDRCAASGVDVYFSPAKEAGWIYESVAVLKNHRGEKENVFFLYGMEKEAVYAKLVIAYSFYSDRQKRIEFMRTNINFEMIYG